MATVQEIAQKMLELFAGDPRRWTQGAMARDADGKSTTARSPDAASWCLTGARYRACRQLGAPQQHDETFLDAVELRIRDEIPHWNDDPERTFADIERLLKELASPS